ncbi:hypothetical protein MRB53_037650 [Persea americana]|nr:hypothetical protein MRB53_037650 [Persea americana]
MENTASAPRRMSQVTPGLRRSSIPRPAVKTNFDNFATNNQLESPTSPTASTPDAINFYKQRRDSRPRTGNDFSTSPPSVAHATMRKVSTSTMSSTNSSTVPPNSGRLRKTSVKDLAAQYDQNAESGAPKWKPARSPTPMTALPAVRSQQNGTRIPSVPKMDPSQSTQHTRNSSSLPRPVVSSSPQDPSSSPRRKLKLQKTTSATSGSSGDSVKQAQKKQLADVLDLSEWTALGYGLPPDTGMNGGKPARPMSMFLHTRSKSNVENSPKSASSQERSPNLGFLSSRFASKYHSRSISDGAPGQVTDGAPGPTSPGARIPYGARTPGIDGQSVPGSFPFPRPLDGPPSNPLFAKIPAAAKSPAAGTSPNLNSSQLPASTYRRYDVAPPGLRAGVKRLSAIVTGPPAETSPPLRSSHNRQSISTFAVNNGEHSGAALHPPRPPLASTSSNQLLGSYHSTQLNDIMERSSRPTSSGRLEDERRLGADDHSNLGKSINGSRSTENIEPHAEPTHLLRPSYGPLPLHTSPEHLRHDSRSGLEHNTMTANVSGGSHIEVEDNSAASIPDSFATDSIAHPIVVNEYVDHSAALGYLVEEARSPISPSSPSSVGHKRVASEILRMRKGHARKQSDRSPARTPSISQNGFQNGSVEPENVPMSSPVLTPPDTGASGVISRAWSPSNVESKRTTRLTVDSDGYSVINRVLEAYHEKGVVPPEPIQKIHERRSRASPNPLQREYSESSIMQTSVMIEAGDDTASPSVAPSTPKPLPRQIPSDNPFNGPSIEHTIFVPEQTASKEVSPIPSPTRPEEISLTSRRASHIRNYSLPSRPTSSVDDYGRIQALRDATDDTGPPPPPKDEMYTSPQRALTAIGRSHGRGVHANGLSSRSQLPQIQATGGGLDFEDAFQERPRSTENQNLSSQNPALTDDQHLESVRTVESAPQNKDATTTTATSFATSFTSQDVSRTGSFERQESTTTPTTSTSPSEHKRLGIRRNVIKELVDTEYSYNQDMKVVSDIYMGTASACEAMRIPLRQHRGDCSILGDISGCLEASSAQRLRDASNESMARQACQQSCRAE